MAAIFLQNGGHFGFKMAAILAIFNFFKKASIHFQIIIKYSSGPNFSQIGPPSLPKNEFLSKNRELRYAQYSHELQFFPIKPAEMRPIYKLS